MFDRIKSVFKPKHAISREEQAILNKLSKPESEIVYRPAPTHRPAASKPAAEKRVIRSGPGYELSVQYVENENATNTEIRFSPRTGHPSDNLNYLFYTGTGLFIKTNRQRKVSVEAFSEDEAVDKLVSDGYDRDSLDIHRSDPDPATPDQIRAMSDHDDFIPEPLCKLDASALINRYQHDEHSPTREILDFATSKKVYLSYYIGLESLYWQIWQAFSPRERIAFYLCVVSKDKKDDWQLSRFDEFLGYADQLMNDSKFIKSFNEHYESDSFKGLGSGQFRRRVCYTIPADMV